MALKAKLQQDWRFTRGLNRTLKAVKSIAADSDNLVCDDIQEAVDRWRESSAMSACAS